MSTQWNSSHDWRVDCQATWGMPKTVDLWDLARNQRSLKGAVPLTVFSRLLEGLPDQEVVLNLDSMPENEAGVVWFEATGESRVGGRASLSLKVQARVFVICQRCLESMVQDLAEDVLFDVITQAQFDALNNEDIDPDESDVVVGSRQFDLAGLLEDQLILAIPYVPKHSDCLPRGLSEIENVQFSDEEISEKPNPFDVLAKLKGKK